MNAKPPQAAAWSVKLGSGIELTVPAATRSLTTYVLMEQERWFEPEMSLLPHLLKPGMHALDIGANHGVYALEIARCTGSGRVWAFEPTSAPRSRLLRSVEHNGMQDRVVVVAAALAEHEGRADFSVHENSELNSREGAGAARESVRLRTLDNYLRRHAAGVEIGFVKLDAEGDELRVLAGARDFFAAQSPVVMFEFKHGRAVNFALLDAWHELGFEIFRWSAELDLLLPFDAGSGETAFALNLFAVRPAGQRELADAGLLVTMQDLASEPPVDVAALPLESMQAWLAQPAMQGIAPDVAGGGELYERLLRSVAAVHFDAALRPAQRAALMIAVREDMLAAAEGGARLGPAAWSMLVHASQALGAQNASVQLAGQLLARWPKDVEIDLPFVPPQRADLARARSTASASWLRQMLAEHIELHAAHSSYFMPPQPQRLAALLQHPDHSAEMERRYLLAHLRNDSVAPLHAVTLLPAAQHTCNPRLWRGLIDAMRVQPVAA